MVTNAKATEEIKDINDYYQKIIKLDLGFWIWFVWQIFLRSVVNLIFLTAAVIYGVVQVVGINLDQFGKMIRYILGAKARLTLGDFYPILNYTSRLIDGLSRISDIEHQINYWSPSVIKMQQALTVTESLAVSPDAVKLDQTAACRVVFDNVGYRYPEKGGEDEYGPPVLHEISFEIEPAGKVALIGQSGSGKTTAMQLLLRFMDPTAGKITVDGVDLRQIDIDSWRRITGYIPQEVQVFSGSLRDNLLYGLPYEEASRITDKELWEIVEALQLNLGTRLKNGLDTQLGHYGIDLSGGQRQRLMIVAAVLKKPCFMVIDEATSSLDGETEHLVINGLKMCLGKEVGALIVTHRLSTVRYLCDRFVMIHPQDGHGGEVIAAASSFEELANLSPHFRQLAAYQQITL